MIYNFAEYKPFPLLEGHLKMGATSKNGEKIDVNNLYITKNGKPFFPVMAEIHFARVPKDEWEDRILKMKANGINVVASYLFWIKCEPVENEFDFTNENDVRYFLSLLKKHGMYSFLRIGPWITAESRGGGLPDWIYYRGIPLRQNDEEFLFYTRRWYEKVYEQVKDYTFDKEGVIIGIQFDNEIPNRPEYLQKLKDMALEIGFTAPIYSATGWNLKGGARLPKDEMIPVWGGYAAKPWTPHIGPINFYGHYRFTKDRNSTDIGNDQIDSGNEVVNLPNDRYPYACAELGTGIPTSKHRRSVITDYDNYSFALVKLGCGNNMPGYYLFCGGKNTLNRGETLNWNNSVDKENRTYPVYNYDFEAPISTHGPITDSYRYLRLLNLFTNNYGEELCEMQSTLQRVNVKSDDVKELRYAMRSKDNKGYIFVNNHIHLLKKLPVNDVQFKLHDGSVVPQKPINVKADVSFFFPFNITYGNLTADYITAQPLCKKDNTYFFVEIEGVEPTYKFNGKEIISAKTGKDNGFEIDGQKFITLTLEEAKHLCQFGDRILIGDNCDLVDNLGEIRACNFGSFAYYEYSNGKFIRTAIEKECNLPKEISYKEVRTAPVNPRFFSNFHNMHKDVGGRRKLHFYDIEIGDGTDGFLFIDYSGDSAQLYLDGEMYEDHHYTGRSWPIPVKDLVGKKIILIIAEYTKDIYVDIEPKTVAGIDKLEIRDR